MNRPPPEGGARLDVAAAVYVQLAGNPAAGRRRRAGHMAAGDPRRLPGRRPPPGPASSRVADGFAAKSAGGAPGPVTPNVSRAASGSDTTRGFAITSAAGYSVPGRLFRGGGNRLRHDQELHRDMVRRPKDRHNRHGGLHARAGAARPCKLFHPVRDGGGQYQRQGQTMWTSDAAGPCVNAAGAPP